MIDPNTILSVHDDRMTLLQWLKTVEEKQNGVAIKSINYSKESTEGAFEYGFIRIEFEDGKVLNSPEFTLANSEELNNVITALATKQDALTPQKLIDFFAPSTDIILDVAEDKSHVEIHLDNELANKIDKALVRPTVAPTRGCLVTILPSNEQGLVDIGAGLEVTESNALTTWMRNIPFERTRNDDFVKVEYAKCNWHQNAVTMVLAGTWRTSSSSIAYNELGVCGPIPNEISSAITPTISGHVAFLDILYQDSTMGANVPFKHQSGYLNIAGNPKKFYVYVANINDLTPNTVYNFRTEVNILL